jgi:hypothetical protein
MIALRIIAGIVGLSLMWSFTFSLCEGVDPDWPNERRATCLVVLFAIAFAFLQFALAGHL